MFVCWICNVCVWRRVFFFSVMFILPPAQYSITITGWGPSNEIPNKWTTFGCGGKVLFSHIHIQHHTQLGIETIKNISSSKFSLCICVCIELQNHFNSHSDSYSYTHTHMICMYVYMYVCHLQHQFDFLHKIIDLCFVSTEFQSNWSCIPLSKTHFTITSFSNIFLNNKFIVSDLRMCCCTLTWNNSLTLCFTLILIVLFCF
jgi:hypothetical protein